VIGVSLPDELLRFVADEKQRTGRNASEILRLALLQRQAALRRYREKEIPFDLEEMT